MNFDKKALGKNIAKYRKETGLTQQRLADLTELHRKFISDLERGCGKLPSINALLRIAEALNIKPDVLLFENLKCNFSDSPHNKLIIAINKELQTKSEDELKYYYKVALELKSTHKRLDSAT